MAFQDLSGSKFGRLSFVQYVRLGKDPRGIWRCDCGVAKEIRNSSVKRGIIVSCGCFHRERMSERMSTHNQSQTPLHKRWTAMKARCLNPKDAAYAYYGGRGITVCDDWLSFEPFYEWCIASGFQRGLTLDRIDNDKGYSPANCRWASRKQQQNNLRTNVIVADEDGAMSLSEAAAKYGLAIRTLAGRAQRGMRAPELFAKPTQGRRTDLDSAGKASAWA